MIVERLSNSPSWVKSIYISAILCLKRLVLPFPSRSLCTSIASCLFLHVTNTLIHTPPPVLLVAVVLIFLYFTIHGIHVCLPQVHARFSGIRPVLPAPEAGETGLKQRSQDIWNMMGSVWRIWHWLLCCYNIYLYETHHCSWYLYESVASNLTRHSVIYLQQKNEMRILGGHFIRRRGYRRSVTCVVWIMCDVVHC